jgi:hypothetical protein
MGDLVRLNVDWHGPRPGDDAGAVPEPSGGRWSPAAIPARGSDAPSAPAALLAGACLRWKRYRPWSAAWISGRCESCLAPFSQDAAVSALHSGYSAIGAGPAGQDDFYWICAPCVDRHADDFGWTVLDTRGRDPSR